MKTIPFNVEKAKAGAMVVNGRGESVRILDYNLSSNKKQNIVAIHSNKRGKTTLKQHNNDGTYLNKYEHSMCDLLLQVEPKYIPYTWETSAGIVGKVVKSKTGFLEKMILGRDKTGVCLDSYSFRFNYLLAQWTFLDGSPCGVLED